MATKPKVGQIKSTKPRFEDVEDDGAQFEGTRFYDLAPAQTSQPEVQKSGFLRGAGDVALSIGQGAVGAVKALTDLGGADNAASSTLGDAGDYLGDLKSDSSKATMQNSVARIKAAEESGSTWEEAKAYMGMLYDQPLEMIGQGVGSFATMGLGKAAQALKLMGAAKAAGVSKEVFMASAAGQKAAQEAVEFGFKANIGVGAGMGVGAVKGSQYEQTYNNAKAQGRSDDEAVALATEAQSYGGAGTMQQLLGGGLGALASATGPIEKLIAGKATEKAGQTALMGAGKGFATEFSTEGAQGSQERYAGNAAAIDAGVLDPSQSMRGVVGQGLQEGSIGGILGGGAGAFDTSPATPNTPAAPPGPMQRATTLDPSAQLTQVQSEEMGDPAVPQTLAPDGRAALLAQQDQQRLARAAEIAANRGMESPDDEIFAAIGAADQVRATKVPGAGPMSAAANAGIEQQAQDIESGKQPAIDLAQAQEADQAAYEQAMAQEQQQAAERDTVDKPVTSGTIAEAQMSEEDKRAMLFSNQPVLDGGQKFTGTQDGDVLNGLGAPFKTKMAALRRATMEGKDWTIAPVFDGFVARRKDAIEQDTAQGANPTPVEAPGAAPQAVEGNAAATDELPAAGSGALEGVGVAEPETPAASTQSAPIGVTPAAPERTSRADMPNELKPDATDEQIAKVNEAEYQQSIKDDIKQRLGLVKPTEEVQKKTPFKSFLREHGINPAHTSDIFGKNRFKANNILPATFRGNGLSLDDLAERAVERGFMTEADAGDTNKLISLIQSEVAGDVQVSSEFATEDAAAQTERVQRMDIEDMADSLGLPFSNDISTDRLASMVNRVSDRVARAPKGGLLKPDRILKNAIDTATRIEQKRAQLAKQLAEFDEATIQEQDALIDLFVDEDGNAITFMRTIDTQTVNQWFADNPTWTNENATDTRTNQDAGQTGAPVTGVSQEGSGNGNQVDTGTQPASAEKPGAGQEGLTAPTRADVLAQQERTDNAQALDDRAQIDAEASRQTLTQQTAPEQRRDTSFDMFGDEKAELESAKREADAIAKNEANKDPNQAGMFDEPAPVAENAATEITHNGTRIYKSKVKISGELSDRWTVESQENKRLKAAGDRAIGGDSLHSTLDAAKAAAEFEAKKDAQDQARKAENDAKTKADQEAAQAKTDANKGKSLSEIKADAFLQQTIQDGETGGVISRAAWVEKLIAAGDKPATKMVDKIKPLSRMAFHRANNQEQAAHEKKIKDGGKVPEYSIGSYVVSKTEHDYAVKVLESAAPKADATPATLPTWQTVIPAKGVEFQLGDEKLDGVNGVLYRIASEAANALTQVQKMNGQRLYAYYLPSTSTEHGAVRLFPDDQTPPKPWALLAPEGIPVGMLTPDNLMARIREALRNAPVLTSGDNKAMAEALKNPPKSKKEKPAAPNSKTASTVEKLKVTPALHAESIVSESDTHADVLKNGRAFYASLEREGVDSPAFGEVVLFDEKGWKYITDERFAKDQEHGEKKTRSEQEVRLRVSLLPKAKEVIANADFIEETRVEDEGVKRYSLIGRFDDGDAVRVIVEERASDGKKFLSVFDLERVAKQLNRSALPTPVRESKPSVQGKATGDDSVTASTVPQPAVEGKPAVKNVAIIEDTGVKLGGARKDQAPSLKTELSDDDISSQPLSKIWPAGEYLAIDDIFASAVAFVARQEVPSKPRVSHRVAQWVKNLKTVRHLAQMISGGEVTKDRFAAKIDESSGLRNFMDKVVLLEAIDRSQWPRISSVEVYKDSYMYAPDGTKVSKPLVRVVIDDKTRSFDGATSVADVVERVLAMLDTEVKQDKRMQFEVRGSEKKGFGINKKGDKEYRRLKTFQTAKEAFSYIKENYDDVVALWDGVKERDNVKEDDVRNSENRPRTGADHRQGKDVSAEQFNDTFGFRGIEFGNWVSQGKNTKDRQGMLNQAYDALRDLSDIIGVPPKAMSLNGSLGLGFGSRGSGKFAAHFEPDTLVINLTKTRGAGSLAHEWLHAMDNYFARQRHDGKGVSMAEAGNTQDGYRKANYVTYKPEPLYVHKTKMSTPTTKAKLDQYFKGSGPNSYYNPENWQLDPKHPQGVRLEVERRFAELVEALDASPMATRASMNDKAPDGYWGRIIERAARSFENYVISKMLASGYQNDYLANVRDVQDFQRDAGRYPYLLPEEVAPIAEAFDNLFGTIQTKETEQGIAMFSTRTSPPERQLPLNQIERLVQSAMRGMKNAPNVRVVASPESIGLTPPLDTVPSGVTLSNGDVYVFQSGIGSILDVDMVVFHELFHKGLQNVMPKADYVAAMQDIAKADSKVQQYASEWSATKAGKAALSELAERFSGKELADQYEALATEEALARIAEDLKAKREMGSKAIRVRRMAAWLAKVADKLGMTRLANSIRALSYSAAEKFVVDTISKAGGSGRGPGGGVKFSAGNSAQTDTAAFKKWFGDSKVVDAQGKPRVMVHASPSADIKAFRKSKEGLWFSSVNDTSDADIVASYNTDKGYIENPNPDVYPDVAVGSTFYPVYISIKSPAPEDHPGAISGYPEVSRLRRAGYDGVIYSDGTVVAFDPTQIKSSIGNNGDYSSSHDMRFKARDIGDTLASAANSARVNKVVDKLNEHFNHEGTLSFWHKTVGSPFDLAQRSVPFKRVFTAVQDFINGVSFYSNEAADLAPKLLPKLENWRDINKSPISNEDNKAIQAPIFQGTLSWARDEAGKLVKIEALEAAAAQLTPEQKAQRLLRGDHISEGVLKMWRGLPVDRFEAIINGKYESDMLKAGVVFTDQELKSVFNLTPEQIKLYREFRSATDKSLDNLAKAEMLRFGGKDAVDMRDMVMDAKDADDASVLLRDHFLQAAIDEPGRSDELTATANSMIERGDKVKKLKEQGYAPLSRFGQYSVDVVVDGERQYFSLFETKHEANQMAAKMKMMFGANNVKSGTVSQLEFQLLQGITPESLELFGNMLGLDSTGDEASDKAFQTYLKLTKNNRSAMKRMIHRKGIAGFNEDAGRVLAAFVYSNGRQTAGALHMGEITQSVNDIPQGQGQLKDAAVRLRDYVQNPKEEAQAMRGLLFAQYLGGSVASAFINFTQPFTVSFPYLTQFGGAKRAGAALLQAMKDQKSGNYEPALANALKKADEEGTTQPQAVHELMAQSRGAATLKSGDGTRSGEAMAQVGNALSKLSMGWGKLFGLAEQINRRSTYIAAFRLAVENKVADPAGFAKQAVDETQFINNKGNKARWGRGAVGATLMTFKSYSINYLELLHRMATKNGPEGKKAAALALGMLFLMAGAGGMPGADDLDDVIDFFAQRLGYNVSSSKARQEFLEELFGPAGALFVERGLTGLPGSPIDVSGRMSMGNLIPGTGLLLKKRDHTRDATEILGAMGDMVQRGFKAGDLALDGNIFQAVMMAAPKAVGNAYKGAQMADSGAYKDDKGYKVQDTTPGEAAFKAIGFQPASVSKVQESNYLTQRAKDFYSLQAADIRARWARGIYEKDQSQVQQARDMMADWNEKNPDQRIQANIPAILKRVNEMRKSKEQRIADTAPKAMKAQLRREIAERAAQ